MYETQQNSQGHINAHGSKTQHLLHDERFWAIFAIVVILALLITLAIIAGQGTGGGPDYTPMYPYSP